MAADPNSIVQEAVDVAIGERGEIGLQVTAYLDDEPVVDVWGGWVRRLGAEVTPRASRSAFERVLERSKQKGRRGWRAHPS